MGLVLLETCTSIYSVLPLTTNVLMCACLQAVTKHLQDPLAFLSSNSQTPPCKSVPLPHYAVPLRSAARPCGMAVSVSCRPTVNHMHKPLAGWIGFGHPHTCWSTGTGRKCWALSSVLATPIFHVHTQETCKLWGMMHALTCLPFLSHSTNRIEDPC